MECPVCLEAMPAERTLACGHRLCGPCEQKMLTAKCPLCRAPIRPLTARVEAARASAAWRVDASFRAAGESSARDEMIREALDEAVRNVGAEASARHAAALVIRAASEGSSSRAEASNAHRRAARAASRAEAAATRADELATAREDIREEASDLRDMERELRELRAAMRASTVTASERGASVMSGIVRAIGWRVDDATSRPYWIRAEGWGWPMTPLSDEEMGQVLHPSGDWLLFAQFDDRALDGDRVADYSRCELSWVKCMRRDATVGDLWAVLRGAYCYGYFEGLLPVEDHELSWEAHRGGMHGSGIHLRSEHESLPVFRLCTGT